MKKEYRILIHKSPEIVLSIIASVAISFYAIYMIFVYKTLLLLSLLLIVGMLPCICMFFYTAILRIIIADDKLIFKCPRPYRTIEVNIKDIYKVDLIIGREAIINTYRISYIENGKKKLVILPDQVQGYQEILDYIEQRRPKDHPANL